MNNNKVQELVSGKFDEFISLIFFEEFEEKFKNFTNKF